MKSNRNSTYKTTQIFKTFKWRTKSFKDPVQRDDMVIVNADKRGTVVIMNVTDYIEKAEGQSNNKEHYCQLSEDQTVGNNETVNNVIERFQKENLITKNVAGGLKTTIASSEAIVLSLENCILPTVNKFQIT